MIMIPHRIPILTKVASSSLGSNDTATNTTLRQVIASSALSGQGYGAVVTFKSSTVKAMSIGAAYIGLKGTAPSFASTPVQLLFGGATTKLIAANSTADSDVAWINIPSGTDIVVALYIANDASNDGSQNKTTETGWSLYTKSGNDASTVSTSGYSGPAAINAFGVSAVQIYI